MVRREFGLVQLVVEVTDTEARVWANSVKGQSMFRLKAVGKTTFNKGLEEVIVIGSSDKVVEKAKEVSTQGTQSKSQ